MAPAAAPLHVSSHSLFGKSRRLGRSFCCLIALAIALMPLSGLAAGAFSAVTRTSAGTLTPGQSLTVSFNLAPGVAAPAAVWLYYRDSTGFVMPFAMSITAGGTLTAPIAADMASGAFKLEDISVGSFTNEDSSFYRRDGTATFGSASGTHAFDFSALDFVVSGAADNVKLPVLKGVTRTSAATLTPGMPIQVSYTSDQGTSTVSYAMFDYVHINGSKLNILARPFATGLFEVEILPWHMSGKYVCTSATIVDSLNRRATYNRDGTMTGDPQIGPAGHSLDLAALDFSISGGVEELVYPKLTQVSRTSADEVFAGSSATFDYTAVPGSNPVALVRFGFIDGSFGSKSVSQANAASGTVTLPITTASPTGRYLVGEVEIQDTQGNSVRYGISTVLTNGWGAQIRKHSLSFLALEFNVGSLATPPTITTQPISVGVLVGGSTSFSVAATGPGTLTYQWRQDGVPIPGATLATYSLTNIQLLQAGSYSAVVSNGVSSATSVTAMLNVSEAGPVGSAPSFVTQPPPILPPLNGDFKIELKLKTSGTTPLVFECKFGSRSISPTSAVLVPDADGVTATLIFSGIKSTDSGTYQIIATNTFGTTASSSASVIVLPSRDIPPNFTSSATTTFIADKSGRFEVTCIGVPDPTFSAVGLPAWLTLDAKTGILTGTAPGNVGAKVVFDLTATNFAGKAVQTFTLVIQDPNTPVITSSPFAPFFAGAPTTFTVTATGSPAPTFTASGLPSWASLNSTTGVISGTPTAGAATHWVTITAHNGRSTDATQSLELNVYPGTFAGIYFGVLDADRGTWALIVNANNTAMYLALLKARGTAIVVPVTINPDGSFSGTATESGPLATNGLHASTSSHVGSGGAKPRAAATFTVGGRISSTGVTGGLSGIGETFSGAADPGGSSALAGYYTAPASNGQGASYAVVGPSGHAFVLIATPTYVDATSTTVGANGQISATTTGGSAVSVTLDASRQTMVAQSSNPAAPVFGSAPRLVNLSVRTRAGVGDRTLIMGYVVSGSGTKQLLVRGLGPLLGEYGVQGSMTDPELNVYKNGAPIDANDNWGGLDQLVQSFASLGASPLKSGSKDAALLREIADGVYSAHVGPKDGNAGIALAEIYDSDKKGARLTNVSARTEVGTGENVLVVGMVLEGAGTETLLVRALGPRLAELGVTGALANPTLRIFNSKGVEVASNTDWAGATEIKNAAAKVGASELPSASSKDAAALVTLQAGVYSVQVSGEQETTGVALVEIYEVPAN